MQCPECAATVPPLREFCPKCGAPTDPGLRAGRDRLKQAARSDNELKGNRNKVLIAATALVTLGLAGNFWNPDFNFDWGRHDRSDRAAVSAEPEARGAVTIGAEQLYQAYRDDADAAERRFEDREMVVTGEFLRIVPDGYGSLDLRLKTSNPEQPVGVDLAGLAIDDAKKLRPGQQVTVSCQGMGDGDDIVWVRECAIQNVGEGSAAPAPPSAPEAPAPAPDEGNGG